MQCPGRRDSRQKGPGSAQNALLEASEARSRPPSSPGCIRDPEISLGCDLLEQAISGALRTAAALPRRVSAPPDLLRLGCRDRKHGHWAGAVQGRRWPAILASVPGERSRRNWVWVACERSMLSRLARERTYRRAVRCQPYRRPLAAGPVNRRRRNTGKESIAGNGRGLGMDDTAPSRPCNQERGRRGNSLQYLPPPGSGPGFSASVTTLPTGAGAPASPAGPARRPRSPPARGLSRP